MPRRVEDIVPSEKRSIRDIPIEPVVLQTSTTRKPKESLGRDVPITKIAPLSPPPIGARRMDGTKRGKNSKIVLVVLSVLIILGVGGYFVSTLMARAIFTVVPRTIPATVDGTYIFDNTGKTNSIPYKIVKESGSVSSSVPALDGPKIETKAKGTITIFNGYSATSRRLVAGTRFDSGNGKIYRISSSIMIPGYTKSSSGQVIPGHINTTLIADQPGEEYNINSSDSISDMKIVAYKGTDKYDSIYGRLTTPVTGGFVGSKKTVAKDVLASTTNNLKAELLSKYKNSILAKIQDNQVTFDKAFTADFGDPVISGNISNTATVTVNGTVYTAVFDKAQLISRLAGETSVDSFKGMPFDITGLDNLAFTISNPKDYSPSKGNLLIARIKGDLMLTGIVPIDTLKSKLSGMALKDTSTIMSFFAPVLTLDKTVGQVVPPWSRIPTDPHKINIIIQK